MRKSLLSTGKNDFLYYTLKRQAGTYPENTADTSLAFGYSFESFMLYAQSLGFGTAWFGGTMNRPAVGNAMELGENPVHISGSAAHLRR